MLTPLECQHFCFKQELLQNTSTPFYCPHCQLKSYESIISNLKLNMATLENKVTSLEKQLEAIKGSAPCLTDPVAGDSQNHPAISQTQSDINTIKFFISEEKERSKRRLNLIIQ